LRPSTKLSAIARKTPGFCHLRRPKSDDDLWKGVIALGLRLYLDDCTCSKRLTAKLRAAGHDVLTPVEAQTSGLPDREHLQLAIADGRIMMTHNCSDFEELHRETATHAGIVAIYQDNDQQRDMTHDDIVRALENLANSGAPLEKTFHVLNFWR